MELGELCEKTLEVFGCKDVSDLGGKLYDAVLNCDIMKLTAFCNTVEDLSIDWLQKIFQYYEADRQEKKQDYTPKSIAKLCAELTETGGKTVYDICAGSGALTIQKWARNSDKLFICEELDEKVIPYLLFNMAVRNMNGYVINRNVLTMECNKVYRLHCGEAFSIVEEIKEPPEIMADEIVSNPPYNIKWDAPKPMFADNRFQEVIPPASNANFAFVLTALSRLKNGGKCAFVLPNGVLQSNIEKSVRQVLTDSRRIEKIILLPDKMFECTTIGTNVCVFGNGNGYIDFYDCRKRANQEQREQNGQFGGKSHTNRTYYKTINVLSDELINELCGECEDVAEFSLKVSTEEVKNQKYSFAPTTYIRFEYQEATHRSYKDIVKNINDIIRLKNSCKLVINESLAKQMGFDINIYKESMNNSKEISNNTESMTGEKMLVDDYISFSKNKNEIIFKSNDKEVLSHLFSFFVHGWKQDIHLLNELENVYLAELRDAMLPDLMSGKLDVSNVKV